MRVHLTDSLRHVFDRNVLSFRGMLSQVLGETKVPRLNPGLGLLSPGTRRSR